MQWLKLVTEDGGIQRLRANNRLPATTPAVDPVPLSPTTHSNPNGEQPVSESRPKKERRQKERRKGGDRRKKQIPVLLDTRSKHDRRALENRRGGRQHSENDPPPRSGVNIFV